MLTKLIDTLGNDKVLDKQKANELYPCPSQAETPIIGVARPETLKDIKLIVIWANQNSVSLYPLSTGKNWGYGGGNPTQENCLIVDLGRMNNIVGFDDRLGLVTVQPGVSQGDLYKFLNEKGADFYTPVTGSSPSCSLIGNALERGYGVTPSTDHFYAVQSIKAVLPDGTLYEGLLPSLSQDADYAGNVEKWGAGPYVEGLFSQGNFGIVYEATFKLIKKATNHTIIIFEPKAGCFSQSVDAAKSLLDTHSGTVQSVKFFNKYYSVALNVPYPEDSAKDPGFNIDEWVTEKAKELGASEWLGMIFIGGTKAAVKATEKDCKSKLKTHASNIKLANNTLVSALKLIMPLMPNIGRLTALKKQVGSLIAAHKLMEGEPQQRFLQAAYWRAGDRPEEDGVWNPGKDGCGLIWFAPFLPFTGHDIENFQKLTVDVCNKFSIFPIFSMTTLSNQGISALLPIMFDPKTELDQAHACHKALFDACQKEGYLPYRAHLDTMEWYSKPIGNNVHFLANVQKAKSVVDKNNTVSPGRYDGIKTRKT